MKTKRPSQARPAKREYHKPELCVYGKLGDLTRAVAKDTGNYDGQGTFVKLRTGS